MVIKVRDCDGNLKIKDILDIDFDMHVETENVKGKTKYYVQLNSNLRLDDEFPDKSTAEESMVSLADARNELENELRNF